MDTSFRLLGIEAERFQPLFLLNDGQLNAMGVRRCFADSQPGFLCRVSLEDAKQGDELLLLSYEHLPAHSPYRAAGPIYVRRDSRRAVLAPGELPPYVSSRLISVRAYDVHHTMLAASVREGSHVTEDIKHFLAREDVAYLHLHNALRGCFSCEVRREAHCVS